MIPWNKVKLRVWDFTPALSIIVSTTISCRYSSNPATVQPKIFAGQSMAVKISPVKFQVHNRYSMWLEV